MKLMAIDGNSLINRAFYGVRPLSNKEGVPTNAIYGFLNMYYKLLGDLQPDGVCVCFDLKAKTFRHKMYDGYKAQRKPMPEDLAVQIPLLKECLDLMGVPRMEMEGFEADDLLGTLARICREDGDGCTIVTGDRDSLQFIAEGADVALVTTRMGQTITDIFNAEKFAEAYQGLTADKIVDLKAIMGDKSDNIPGIPGIGEKGAMDLLVRFGSLQGVYDNLETGTFTPSVRKKLTEGRELAFLSYDLAKGITDVPVERCPQDLLLGEGDKGGLYDFLDRMELRSIIKRLGLTPSAHVAELSAFEVRDYALIRVAARLQKLLGQEAVCAFAAGMDMAAFVVEGKTYVSGSAYVGSDAWKEAIAGLLTAGRYIVHDAKPLALALFKQDKTPAVPVFDTAIAAYLMAPTSSDFSLENCAVTALDVVLADNEEESGQMTLGLDDSADLKKLSRRAQVIAALYSHYKAQLEAEGMLELMETIELPLIRILAEMQHLGMELDTARLQQFGDGLTADIDRLEGEIYEAAGETFNIGSPKQLGVVLFEKLGLPARKKTKTGYSTDADTLEKLKDAHPIIELILEYRKLTKLKSTYVEGLLKTVAADGRVHSSFNQMVTATGRLSSTDPNMQNIPVREAIGAEIRKCFVPRQGHIFVDADYSQIELRILAHMSGDQGLIDAYRESEDIHRITASKVFHTPFEEVTPLQRRNAKAVNFGIVYGISSFGLSQGLSITRQEASEYIKAYFKTYPGIKTFLDDLVASAKKNGYAKTMYGRRRPVPELSSSNFMQRSFGERVAMNSPIQGSAADIMKIAMIRVWERIAREQLRSRLILQIHDELLIETAPGEEDTVRLILEEEMEHAAELSVRLETDVHCGSDWYMAK